MDTNAAITIKCKTKRKAGLHCLKTVFLKNHVSENAWRKRTNTGKSQGREARRLRCHCSSPSRSRTTGPSSIPGSQIHVRSPRLMRPHCPAKYFSSRERARESLIRITGGRGVLSTALIVRAKMSSPKAKLRSEPRKGRAHNRDSNPQPTGSRL